MNTPRLLTTKEAADLLGITPRTVRYLCEHGVIEAQRVGTQWLMTAAAVEAARSRKYQGRGRPGKEAQSKE